MGQGEVFKVGDEVIGHDVENRTSGLHYDGRVGIIDYINLEDRPNESYVKIKYPDNDYWFYLLTELVHAKNHIVNQLINDL